MAPGCKSQSHFVDTLNALSAFGVMANGELLQIIVFSLLPGLALVSGVDSIRSMISTARRQN